MSRIEIPKTYKLFINGAFPRSERGRVLAQTNKQGQWMANYAWATRKDFRNAMVAARAAQAGWAKRTAFNRSLILYRIAEVLEDRREQFERKLVEHAGYKQKLASREVSVALDRIFYYAGWADKYGQVLSSVNPVGAPFFNFTTPEPTGVVTTFTSQNAPLLGLIEAMCPVILSGNTVILIVENAAPTLAIDLAEVIATSDVPAGVVNILTGKRDELIGYVAGHKDLNAIVYFGEDKVEIGKLETESAENVKRTKILLDPKIEQWLDTPFSLYSILPTLEFKTAWHPIGV